MKENTHSGPSIPELWLNFWTGASIPQEWVSLLFAGIDLVKTSLCTLATLHTRGRVDCYRSVNKENRNFSISYHCMSIEQFCTQDYSIHIPITQLSAIGIRHVNSEGISV